MNEADAVVAEVMLGSPHCPGVLQIASLATGAMQAVGHAIQEGRREFALHKMNEFVGNLTAALNATNTQVGKLVGALDASTKELANAQAVIQSLRAELAKRDADVDELVNENNALRDQVAGAAVVPFRR